MKKILHIARPLSGVGVYVSLLTKHIDNDKFINIIACNKLDNNILITNSIGEKIQHFNIPLKREISFLSDLKCIIELIKIIKKQNPDILHCHSAKAGIIGRIVGFLLKRKTFYTPHAYSYLSTNNKIKKSIYFFVEKILALLPNLTLACSVSEYNKSLNDLKITKRKVLVWKNSIERIIYTRAPTEYTLKNQDYICAIGRPSFQKNTLLLIKSILVAKKDLPNIQLVILGVGFYSPDKEVIEIFIKKYNLEKNITLIPWLKREESLHLLKNSKFLVSTSRYEGLPYSVIEAFALSKPCLLSNVDGHRDIIINNYNGFLAQENSKDISKKIIIMLKNKALLKEMSFNSRTFFEEFFLIEKNIKKLENIYLQ